MENFVFPDEIVKNDWKFENIFPISKNSGKVQQAVYNKSTEGA